MPAITEPKLIAGNANMTLAKAIARRMSMHRGMSVNLVDARVERFNDAEIFVEVYENVRGEDMYIIQPTSNPANDNLMELLIISDALRRSSADRITAVIPYFGYARQDRRAKARTPITAKLVANMITEAGIDRVLTLDLHAAQIQGFFDIPVDNLYASPIFALDIEHNFKGQMGKLMVVSPDVGGVARARELAKRINAPLAIVDKRREKAGEVAEMTVIGDVAGHICIMVDDLCDTGGTHCKAAEVLMAAAEAWFLPDANNIPMEYAKVGTWYDFFAVKAAAAQGELWKPGSATFQYPNLGRAATIWYHDHAVGMTRLNVYAGPAGFFIIRGGPEDRKSVV